MLSRKREGIERNGRKFKFTKVIRVNLPKDRNFLKNSIFCEKNQNGELDQKCHLGNSKIQSETDVNLGSQCLEVSKWLSFNLNSHFRQLLFYLSKNLSRILVCS